MRAPWVIEAAAVAVNEPVDPTMYRLALRAPQVAAAAGPGQFVTLALPGSEPLLPRPFDLHFADPEAGVVEFVYRVKGRGTQALAALPPGSALEVHGPFGRDVAPLLPPGGRIALVGRGAGISPLYFIGRRAHETGAQVTAYLSARSRRLLEPFLRLQEVARVVARSDDLHPGHLVTTELAEDLATRPLDAAFVVGSRRLAKETLALGERHGFTVYGFAESFMPCGFGHCKACAIPTRDGYILACVSGPVIELKEVSDEYWSVAPT